MPRIPRRRVIEAGDAGVTVTEATADGSQQTSCPHAPSRTEPAATAVSTLMLPEPLFILSPSKADLRTRGGWRSEPNLPCAFPAQWYVFRAHCDLRQHHAQ